MPDYRDIYNHVVETDHRYNLAENSPGLRAVIQATDRLSLISGRALDVGCGVGFVVEYLSGPTFDLNVFGVDISDLAIDRAITRLQSVAGARQRLKVLQSQTLPFPDNHFQLITCFDVLEHLDPTDIESTLAEVERVLAPGGTFYGAVSCRTSGVEDQFGDNLHRTVRSPDWWIETLSPDKAEYDGHRIQLGFWRRLPLVNKQRFDADKTTHQTTESSTLAATSSSVETAVPTPHRAPVAVGVNEASGTAKDTSELYQQIYDDNPWYGDAEQGRCPGMRLLPEYKEWLKSPVMDLGCGRGQTVEHLRSLGFEAEGIDQIRNNPDMRVGDITQPIDDISKFNSVVCVDCIEHLYESQVLGLFENMKQVKRQAFSIHNGESTGTGQELHVNRKDFIDWTKLIREHFEIASAIQITNEQVLYLTQTPEAND